MPVHHVPGVHKTWPPPSSEAPRPGAGQTSPQVTTGLAEREGGNHRGGNMEGEGLKARSPSSKGSSLSGALQASSAWTPVTPGSWPHVSSTSPFTNQNSDLKFS